MYGTLKILSRRYKIDNKWYRRLPPDGITFRLEALLNSFTLITQEAGSSETQVRMYGLHGLSVPQEFLYNQGRENPRPHD